MTEINNTHDLDKFIADIGTAKAKRGVTTEDAHDTATAWAELVTGEEEYDDGDYDAAHRAAYHAAKTRIKREYYILNDREYW